MPKGSIYFEDGTATFLRGLSNLHLCNLYKFPVCYKLLSRASTGAGSYLTLCFMVYISDPHLQVDYICWGICGYHIKMCIKPKSDLRSVEFSKQPPR